MQSSPPDPRTSLATLRILWAALLLGQLVFLAVIVFFIVPTRAAEPDAALANLLLTISVIAAVVAAPGAFFLRGQLYKAAWRGDAVTPGGYLTANLIFFAILEGVSFFSLIVAMLAGAVIPFALPSFACMALHVVNFPHGRPMQGDQFAALRRMHDPDRRERG